MRIAKYQIRPDIINVGCVEEQHLFPLRSEDDADRTLHEILEADDPRNKVESLRLDHPTMVPMQDVRLLAPIARQEVWAAGVTYRRSKTARMEESEAAASCYDRVYQAERPEIFFKATPHRVVGPEQPIRIRVASKWNVPEPELTLVLNSRLDLVGFTAGNDVSSRDIEGENPLYLPQAKLYNQSCALGPWITLAHAMPEKDKIDIKLVIQNVQKTTFQATASISQMARTFEDLIQWLGRDNSFPHGAFLMTGTGIVPENNFTLLPDDTVHITISGIGTLSNPVVQG